MTRMDRLIDELGYMPGVGSQDEPRPERFEIQRTTEAPTENDHGYDAASIAAVHAAIDQEDQPSPRDAELDLFLRRFRMEKALIAVEKDRLLVEMAAIIVKVQDVVAIPPDDSASGATAMAARLIAQQHGAVVDQVCLSVAQYRRTGKFTAILSESDVRDWKP